MPFCKRCGEYFKFKKLWVGCKIPKICQACNKGNSNKNGNDGYEYIKEVPALAGEKRD